MIGIKKFVSNELLQIAILLSIIKSRNNNYFNTNNNNQNQNNNNNFDYESPTIGVGDRNNNGDEWNHTSLNSIHSNVIHPKSIINYQEDIIHELNSLGRYNRINYTSDVTAYLLNFDNTAGGDLTTDNNVNFPSIGENSTGQLPSQSSTANNNVATVDNTANGGNNNGGAEINNNNNLLQLPRVDQLTKEDMTIIEMLWKQDAETNSNYVTSEIEVKTEPEDSNRFISGGATNSNDTDPEPSSSYTQQIFEDTNEDIKMETSDDFPLAQCLNDRNNDPSLTPSSSKSFCNGELDIDPTEDFFPYDFDYLKPMYGSESGSSGGSGDFLFEDDIKNEFKEEEVESSDDFPLVADEAPLELLGFPKDDFLINDALQLCELNDCGAQGVSNNFSSTTSKYKEEKEEIETKDNNLILDPELLELDILYEMMQTAQYHPASRSYHHQSRVPYRSSLGIPGGDQRWQDFASNFATDQNSSYPHHHHHHHVSHMPHHSHSGHHNYSSNMTYHHPEASTAILHNATLPPPIGDLNNTSPYHLGASPNLGSALTSSMNLTNCDNDSVMGNITTPYKMDDSIYYHQHNSSNQSMNNQSESFFPSILNDDDLQFMDIVNENMYGNMLDNVTSNASNNMTTTLLPPERCTDSDSAVSSMGSERVPSLSSDNEWMETNSDSGHTPGDHYSAEYSKYRWYDNYIYSMRSHSMGNDLASGPHRIPPPVPAVAQKKYQLYGKRLFHDQNNTGPSTSGDMSSLEPPNPSNIKYELNDTDSSRLLEPSCSTTTTAKSFSPSEMKYSCSSEFSKYTSHRPSLSELVSHNHTYSVPPETLGATSSRSCIKDKTAKYIEKLRLVDIAVRKSDEEQLTRDEKKARAMNIPIDVHDIINLPMDEFNERLSKYDLSEAQLSLIRDIRRRGKNKVAAQNCRKRKLDQILSLADEVKQMKDKKRNLYNEHEYLSQEVHDVKNRFSLLYKHVFSALRDSDGNPYSPYEFTLEQTNDGNVELVRRNHLTHPTSSKDSSSSSSGHSSNSSMDSTSHQHHYRSKDHKDYHDHRKD